MAIIDLSRWPVGEGVRDDEDEFRKILAAQEAELRRRQSPLEPPEGFPSSTRIVPTALLNQILAARHLRIGSAIALHQDGKAADFNERLTRISRQLYPAGAGSPSVRSRDTRSSSFVDSPQEPSRQRAIAVQQGQQARHQAALGEVQGPFNKFGPPLRAKQEREGAQQQTARQQIVERQLKFAPESAPLAVQRRQEVHQAGINQIQPIINKFESQFRNIPVTPDQVANSNIIGLNQGVSVLQDARDAGGSIGALFAALATGGVGYIALDTLKGPATKVLETAGKGIEAVEDAFREEVLAPIFQAAIFVEDQIGQGQFLVGDVGRAVAAGEDPAELEGLAGTLGKGFNAATSPVNLTIAGAGLKIVGLTRNVPIISGALKFAFEPILGSASLTTRIAGEAGGEFAASLVLPQLGIDDPLLNLAIAAPLAGVAAPVAAGGFNVLRVAPRLATATAQAAPALWDNLVIEAARRGVQMPPGMAESALVRDFDRTGGAGPVDLSGDVAPIGGGAFITGNTTVAFQPNPNKPMLEFVYTVFDIDELITSNLDNLEENPNYPQELQPRDRSRAVDRVQIDELVQNPNVDFFLHDPGMLQDGIPIVGPDKIVEAGNGRTLAIRLMINENPAGYADYVQRLRETSEEKFGISPTAFADTTSPILVRMRISDLEAIGMSRQEFAIVSNNRGNLGTSRLEDANNMAEAIPDEMVAAMEAPVSKDGEPPQDFSFIAQDGQNLALVSKMSQAVDPNERTTLFGEDGRLSTEGIELFQTAMFVKAFAGDAGRRLARTLYEIPDDVLRRVGSAVQRAAPIFAKAEAMIRLGQRSADLSITEDLAAATDVLGRLRQQNITVAEYLAQGSLFGNELTPFQQRLLEFLADAQKTPARLRRGLTSYAQAIVDGEITIRETGETIRINNPGQPRLDVGVPGRPGIGAVLGEDRIALARQSLEIQGKEDLFERTIGQLPEETPGAASAADDRLAGATANGNDLPESTSAQPRLDEFNFGDDGPRTAEVDADTNLDADVVPPDDPFAGVPEHAAERVVDADDVDGAQEIADEGDIPITEDGSPIIDPETGDPILPNSASIQEVLIPKATDERSARGQLVPDVGGQPARIGPGRSPTKQGRLDVGTEARVRPPTGDQPPAPSRPSREPVPGADGSLSDVTRGAGGPGSRQPPAPPGGSASSSPPGGNQPPPPGGGSKQAPLPNDVHRAPPTAKKLFDLEDVTRGLTTRERAVNLIKEQLSRIPELAHLVGDPINEHIRPLTRVRDRVAQEVTSQANVRAQQAVFIAHRVFNVDRQTGQFRGMARAMDTAGIDPEIPRNPTVQDIAAHLPTYRQFLNEDQLAAMFKLQEDFAPYTRLLHETGKFPGTRSDVEAGGFYLPRGFATDADFDGGIAGKRAPRRNSRKAFENGAVFDSMAQGIEKGFAYPSLEEALRNYVVDSSGRAMDAWEADYLRKLEDPGTGQRIGKDRKGRLIVKDPVLFGDLQDIRRRVSRLRSAEIRLTDEQKVFMDRFLLSSDPDVDLMRDQLLDLEVQPNALGVESDVTGFNLEELRADRVDAEAELRELSKEAEQKLKTLGRDEGTITEVAGLQNLAFPKAVADAMNDHIRSRRPPTGKGTKALKATVGLNMFLRGLNATFDFSYTGVQGLVSLASDPKSFQEAWTIAMMSLHDPAVAGAYMIDFDAAAKRTHTPNTSGWVADGLAQREARFETAAVGLDRVPLAGVAIRSSNRAFGTFGDIMRLELARNMYATATQNGATLTKVQRQDIANTANLITGWSRRRLGEQIGLGEFSDFAFFAPRFFQSQLELVVKAVRGTLPGGSIGDVKARNALMKTVGYGVMLTMGANAGFSLAGEESIPILELIDPTSSNFMRIRVGGSDISIFGPWDSLVRGLVQSFWHGDPTFLARSKSSPVVSIATDLISGENFVGEDARTLGALVENVMPFSVTGFFDGDTNTGVALGFLGIKSRPVTPSEHRDIAIRNEVKAGILPEENDKDEPINDFRDLTFKGKLEFLERNPEYTDIGKFDEAINAAVTRVSEQRIVPALLDYQRTFNPRGIQDAVGVAVAVLLRESALTAAELGLDSAELDDDPTNPFDRAVADYYRVFTDPQLEDEGGGCILAGGGLDNACVSRKLDELEDTWTQDQRDFVEAETGRTRQRLAAENPIVANLEKLQDEVDGSGYNDVAEDIWKNRPDDFRVGMPLGWPPAGYEDTYRDYRRFLRDTVSLEGGVDPILATKQVDGSPLVKIMMTSITGARTSIIARNPRIGAILQVLGRGGPQGEQDSPLRGIIEGLLPQIRSELEDGVFGPSAAEVAQEDLDRREEEAPVAAVPSRPLTADQEEALRLVEDEELTAGQIAIRMGRTPDAIKKLLRRGRQRREELAVPAV